MIGEQYLLLPGPTPVPERVVRAMSRPMVNHRGSEFKEILINVTDGIKQVYHTQHQVLIYPASGTGALEAAVVNFISPGDKVLAVSIGVFGDRFATIAREFGAQVEKLDFPWGEPADPQVVKERLEQDKKQEIKAVLITHNETSTGVFNDLAAIRAAVGEHPALFMVDAVSGLAAVAFKMDEWKLDVVASGSQKAFMIPPGLSFLAFNDRALRVHKENKNHKYYWDVSSGLKYLEKGQTPYTPAISLFYGLEEALKMMQEEGLDNILLRQLNYREMVRAALKEMGLKLLAADDNASPALTSVIAPQGIGGNKIRQYMRERFNIILAGGQQRLDDVIFRIGHLGYVRELDLLSVLVALEITLLKSGYPIELGKGIKKAQEYISAT
ncbi:MAG: alanine--glyoxylate aminotransferase family protein [Syntrophomonas sp.]|uniref:pyridoxal-phosphate-dependent aminotransferase family protein n=1 Tax=Syntrophomonas sp. TaxID=2053627 RepID=UPI00262F68FD|nr:alanine--glyoxylate aminotransferase family protein [Syntrophomonas sp.]MDD2510000.1 alanine--glyoxylate aminotransferase family protein [Syntrophomonas sp.]MDD3878962.1 alanine--glyoxylate aminotransferase family protein [Syntrophomonas sp.]MDD4626123.1 alanine--glyoxylate aminotransferase family protein [Syntrophomonas sp.]